MGSVHVRWLNWVVVLRPTNGLLGSPESDELEMAWKAVFSESYQGIVINLLDVRRIGSIGLGLLIKCHADARRTHTKLAVCWNPEALRDLDAIPGWNFPSRNLRFTSEEQAVRFCAER